MLALLLLACPGPTVLVGGETGESPGEDSADSGSAPVTDFSRYVGSRRFVADEGWYTCDDTETDEGTELRSGEVFSYLQDLCPSCDHFYQNEPSPTSLCDGYLMIGTAWRAVHLRDDGTAAAYFILGYDTYYSVSTADENAAWNGRDLDFAYTLDLGGIAYETTGSMSFPLETE